MWDMWWRVIWIILVTAFVSLLAYYLIKLMAGGTQWRRAGSRNLRIIEAISVGAGATIQLIKTGSIYMIIGVSRTGITALGTLSADEVTEIEQVELTGPPFAKILERFLPRSGEDEAGESGKDETSL